MKFNKYMAIILILILEVNFAGAVDVKIWDSMVNSTNPDAAAFTNFAAWGNKMNWSQVPYGTTNYVFRGDAIIDNGAYWVLFHSNNADGPYMYGNIEGVPAWNAEIYGKRLNTSFPNGVMWNFRKNSIIINENKADKISLTVDSGTIIGKNIITYVSRANMNSLEIIPETSDVYDIALHSSPNRQVVAPKNDGAGTDYIADPMMYDYFVNSQTIYLYPDTNHNKMLLQEVKSDGSRSIYTVIPKDPATAKLQIGITKENNYIRLGTIRNRVEKGRQNDRVYFGTINNKNMFWTFDINKFMAKGTIYTSSLIVGSASAVPGRWRMTARMNVGGVLHNYTKDVYSGKFNFTAPVGGTLEVLTMYLYDRTTSTPSDVKTPMDMYQEIMDLSNPNIVSTPTFSSSESKYPYTKNVTISITTAGSTIHYTKEGTTTAETSPIYSKPINDSATTTLKAIAWKAGLTPNPIATAIYIIGNQLYHYHPN